MNHEEYKRKALEPIVNYIESVMASYSKEELEARIKKALPELKESNDERIRKWLYDNISNCPNNNFAFYGGVGKDAVLNYLEKKKEYVSDNFDDVWTTEDCAEIIEAGEKLSPRFKELFKEVCHAWYDKGIELEKQKEQKPAVEQLGGTFNSYDMAKTFAEGQYYVMEHPEKFGLCKPAEWSKEDEEMLERCISHMINIIPVPGKHGLKDMSFEKHTDDELVTWLNLLPQRFSLQPKQELSEEDKDKVDDICKLIEHATIIPRSGDDDTGIPPTRLNDKYKGELKAFVKSLRPQPHWKPSEEQLRELRCVISGCSFETPILVELEEQLKKL